MRAPVLLQALTTGLLVTGLGGCSLVSPVYLWEMAKAGGASATYAISVTDGQASHTVAHALPPIQALCIEFNPRVPVADIVPALQTALRDHRIDSRVYDQPVWPTPCSVWLKYTAYIEWDIPPFGSNYKPYINIASLTLHDASGQILSSSQYLINDAFGRSKWASTREKLAPVVTALLTGRDTPEPPAGSKTPAPASTLPAVYE